MPERGDPALLPDLFDQIFDLPLDWEFNRGEEEISLDLLEEFSRLATEISICAMDTEYIGAIGFMWSARKYVGITHYNNRDFKGTEVSQDQAIRIRDELRLGKPTYPSSLAPVASSGPTLSALMMQKDRDLIFEIFLEKERVILRNWGLNQQSVEIIIARTRKYKVRILMNMLQGGTVNREAIYDALQKISSMSDVPVSASRKGFAGSKARSSQRRNFVGAKDKLIGVATLFGDVAPLMLGQPLDVSNFISNASGATVAAILPRGEAKQD